MGIFWLDSSITAKVCVVVVDGILAFSLQLQQLVTYLPKWFLWLVLVLASSSFEPSS